MIRVYKEAREIEFIPEETREERPPPRCFPLLSAYVCPFCGSILAAYFQGYLSGQDIAYYEKETCYTLGSVPGGHYLKMESHGRYGSYGGSERCPWEVFSKRGLAENLKAFAGQHDLPQSAVQPLAKAVGIIRGFRLVEDVCGRDGEMLLFSYEALLEDVRKREGFDAYWEAKRNLGKYLMDLVNRKEGQGGAALAV